MAHAQVIGRARPAGEGSQLAAQGVLARLGLAERRHLELVLARPPATMPVAPDPAALDLHDEQPMLGMDDQQIRLAVARRRMGPGPIDPAHVRVQPVRHRQRLAQAGEHPLFGGRWHGRMVSGG